MSEKKDPKKEESSAASKAARKQWELENNVKTTTDDFYHVDKEKMKVLDKARPWKTQPNYFTSVRMSALAMIKIVMHAKTGQGKAGIISDDAGNWVEVMGLLQGHYDEGVFIVTDSFAMPVDASEVECSMNEASQLYMINYCTTSERLGKKDCVVGYYHSHPGYSCFLSGIDVNTQTLNQSAQDPFIAIVVDPVRTISTGKVELKAFRTFPEGYTPPSQGWDMDAIPQNKVEEYGVYLNRYYEVPVSYFRSEADSTELDLLWNKYWMKTLSTSPLVTNRFFTDNALQTVTQKMDKVESSNHGGGRGGRKKPEGPSESVNAATKAIASVSNEFLQGLMGMQVKQALFNPDSEAAVNTRQRHAERVAAAAAADAAPTAGGAKKGSISK